MTEQQAMRMALEALEFDSFYGTKKQKAITALRQALEQQPDNKSSFFDSGVYVGSHIGKEIKHTPFTLQPDDLKIDRETIIKLAMEAGLLHESDKAEIISECGVEVWLSPTDGVNTLERFANLIAQHEREECAVLAETSIGTYDVVVACGSDPIPQTLPRYMDYYDIAKAIRLRGNT